MTGFFGQEDDKAALLSVIRPIIENDLALLLRGSANFMSFYVKHSLM